MKSVRLVIGGRVQGVGFRDWLAGTARQAGLRGWVRNLGSGEVEAVLCGDADAVDRVASACRQGPPGARVESLARSAAPPVAEPGFGRLPSSG